METGGRGGVTTRAAGRGTVRATDCGGSTPSGRTVSGTPGPLRPLLDLDPDLDPDLLVAATGFPAGSGGRGITRGTTLATGLDGVTFATVTFAGVTSTAVAVGRFAAAAGACAFGRAPDVLRARAGALTFLGFAERDAELEVLGFVARVLRGAAMFFLP